MIIRPYYPVKQNKLKLHIIFRIRSIRSYECIFHICVETPVKVVSPCPAFLCVTLSSCLWPGLICIHLLMLYVYLLFLVRAVCEQPL